MKTTESAERRPERGSALILAVLVMVIMSLMGLAYAMLADVENKISINERHQAQALYVAEGTAWVVRNWFEDSTAAYLLPTASQVNRTLRYVDNDADGTFTAYTSAPSPWNVTYRSGTDDLFNRPYRGTPALSFEGNQTHPDVRISSSGSS